MIVELEGLTKSFPVRRTWGRMLRAPFERPRSLVVDGVTFSVAEGEIFGLLGQNGAGKTTIFRMLSTLVLPDSGRATIAGLDTGADDAAVRRLLAPVIANERSLSWRLSARENIRLFAALQGLQGAVARREEARVLGITGLADTGAKMVGEFSSGMRQRLLIARALLGEPRVLLLDEPTRSLDPISARDFRRFLRETVVREHGCTVLLATHDADEVWELCDRVAVLERGRLLAVDATGVLRHRAGSDRFLVWIRAEAVGAATERARRAGFALQHRGVAAERGWDEFECSIEGGSDGAARALLALRGDEPAADVARFERVPPSLADLIERVVRSSRAPAGIADA